MGKKGRSNDVKYKRYLGEKRRIKNKTRKLEKRIKDIKPESQEKIRKACPLGRKKEK